MLKRFERIGPSAASSTTTPPAGRPQRIPDTDMPWPAMILDFQERIDSTNYQMIEEYRTVIGALKNTGRQALGEGKDQIHLQCSYPKKGGGLPPHIFAFANISSPCS